MTITTARPMQPVEVWLFRAHTPGTDLRQVPASSATITVRPQGATVTNPDPVLCTTTSVSGVAVGHRGRIQIGDILQNGADASKTVVVADIQTGDGTDLTKIVLLVSSQFPPTQYLNPGDRLVVKTRTGYQGPALYSDQAGLLPISGNAVTINSLGYARFYCPEPSVDYIASGGGLPSPLVFQDVQAGWAEASRPTLNVLDFPSFQAAHDALPAAGGEIFVPAGVYTSTSKCAFTGLQISKAMSLVGEVNSYGEAVSKVTMDMTNSKDTTAISINILGGCSIRNMLIQWPESIEAGSGRGVRWYKPGATVRMAGVTLENVIVHRSPNLAFEFLVDGHDASYVSKLEMLQCRAYEAKSGGSLFVGGAGTNNNWFERCEFNGPGFGSITLVQNCTVTMGQSTVSADSFSGVSVGDVVSGMGISVGTKVQSVGSTSITMDQPAIQSFAPSPLSFYRTPATGSMPRGAVHLQRTLISRFSQCSFLGPSTSPALSTDLISGDLEMRDCFRKPVSTGTNVHSFVISGMAGLLIDGLYQDFRDQANLLLRTGPEGLIMGKLANVQLRTTGGATNTDVIVLSNSGDELAVENSYKFGASRRTLARPMMTLMDTAISGPKLTLPNYSDQGFRLAPVSAATIRTIEPVTNGRALVLIPSSMVTISDSTSPTNLVLQNQFVGNGASTISLLCDGTSWFEVARSIN